MKIREYHFPSATGECEIYANCYTPDNEEAKAVLVIHHGMAEHQGRYEDFIKFLTSKGYAVYMHDMANHGKSNQNPELTGYFGKEDGYKNLIKDFKTNIEIAINENPDKKVIVMGHSMGSFVCRMLTSLYSDIGYSGAIYMGSGGANPIAGVGEKIAGITAKLTGYTKKVAFLDKIAFGAYNNKFEKRTNFDWLTRDNSIVDKYIADDYCGFLFSAQGMNDLIKLNVGANTDEWYEGVSKDLPILIVSGEMDPVGEYGKGITQYSTKLKETGHSKVTTKIYKDCRHEILNELNKDEVYNDIAQWIESIL